MIDSHLFLLLLYSSVKKLNHAAAFDTDHVIMMILIIQLEHRAAPFKIVADHQASVFKLGQYPIHSSQPNGTVILRQALIDFVGRKVAYLTILKNGKHPQPRQRGFKACLF